MVILFDDKESDDVPIVSDDNSTPGTAVLIADAKDNNNKSAPIFNELM